MTDDKHPEREERDMRHAEESDMDALDRLIIGAAAEYNRPPAAAPRDAMWGAILATRGAAAGGPAAAATGTPDGSPNGAPNGAPAGAPGLRVVRATVPAERTPDAEPRRWADRRWVGLLAAASLLLATGVGLGRWWGESRAEQAARARGAAGAAGPQVAAVTPRAGDTASADRSAEGASAGVPDAATDATPDATPDGTPDATPDRGVTRGVDVRGRQPDGRAAATPRQVAALPGAVASTEGAGDAAYDVAAQEHFTAAEALLVSYRTTRSGGELSDSLTAALDIRLSSWARQLLQDTRLLLDSPAGTDPRRRQLLEDLELVLAQITRLGTPRSPAAAERAAIDGNIQRGQVLSRLRTAIPSGT